MIYMYSDSFIQRLWIRFAF